MATDDTDLRADRLSAIKADIVAHVGRHDLSLGWLAQRHGLRPRQIQNLFYAEGAGFSAFLLEHRLTRAFDLLTDPAIAGRNTLALVNTDSRRGKSRPAAASIRSISAARRAAPPAAWARSMLTSSG